MPNPKGNPDIVKYGFKSDRPEPCTDQITVRIPPSQKKKLKSVDGWQEIVRNLVAEITEDVPA